MQVEWRRTKVLELLSKGDSQSDIAKTLQVDLSIISRDVYFKTAGQRQYQKIH
jgi:transcriptional regulator